MKKLKIEYVDIGTIKPYENNAKVHTDEQIQEIEKSIKDYGMKDPIGVWHDTIVEGHGRYLACQKLKMKEIPVIRLDDLSDAQRKAYTLIHNKLTMDTALDLDLVNAELEDIDLDLSDFGLELKDDEDDDDEDVPDVPDPRDPSCQHNVFENQENMQFDSDNYYGIPEMTATDTVGDNMMRFCDWKEDDDLSQYIACFYYDDYKFISAWRDPDKYIDRLKRFKAVVSPDFSLYTDFPRALQILSCYRRQWCGAYWQMHGLDVIPDVVWGDEDSYDYCFLGIPSGGTVAVSSVGVKQNADWNNEDDSLFLKGYNEMMNRLEPKTVLYYGDMIDGLEGNIIRIPSYYEKKRKVLNNG